MKNDSSPQVSLTGQYCLIHRVTSYIFCLLCGINTDEPFRVFRIPLSSFTNFEVKRT